MRKICSSIAFALFMSCVSGADVCDSLRYVDKHIKNTRQMSDFIIQTQRGSVPVQYDRIFIDDLVIWNGFVAYFNSDTLYHLWPHLKIGGSVEVSEKVELLGNVMETITKGGEVVFDPASCFRRENRIFVKIQ